MIALDELVVVARETTALALVASQLGAIDGATLRRAQIDGESRRGILLAAFDRASRILPAELRTTLRASVSDDIDMGESDRVPEFVLLLARQPRAGATAPDKPRLVLEPAESHAEHCFAVATYAMLVAPRYGTDGAAAFLLALAHHLHNAALPDSGFAGEVLLGPHLDSIVERFTEEALAQMPVQIASRIRELRRELLPSADRADSQAFHAADVIDRVLQVRHYARVAGFEFVARARRSRTRARRSDPAVSRLRVGRSRRMIDECRFRADSPHSFTDGAQRWPVIEAIPFVRVGRESLASAAVAALDADNDVDALALLLADRDDWDSTIPPSASALRELVRSIGALTFVEAMNALGFGPVATYFAHRWSDPTFVAGLGLLAAHRPLDGFDSFELACGAGHYLRELLARGVAACGADVVFAKLWLARRFVAPEAQLICFDAAKPWPIASGAFDLAHVHDALYFLPQKPLVTAELRRITRASGTIAVSHAHNAAVENFSAGESLDRAGYAALFPDAVVYDDRALTHAVVAGTRPIPGTDAELDGAAALAFVMGPLVATPRACTDDVAMPPFGAPLVRNPLYADSEAGQIRWPSERYKAEYASLATFPRVTDAPLRAAMSNDVAPFARTRELVALPERW